MNKYKMFLDRETSARPELGGPVIFEDSGSVRHQVIDISER